MTPESKIPFNADLIEAFAGTFLSPMYDNPQPTPPFHREGWRLYCSDDRLCAIAAPREHAKSTAFTPDFAIAAALFRFESHILVVPPRKLALAHPAIFRSSSTTRKTSGRVRHHRLPVD